MADESGSKSRPTFKQDFLKFVAERVAVAGMVMPGCNMEEYQRFVAKHSCLFEEICDRLEEGDKQLLGEFDFISEVLTAFDTDNAYIQGFADGMIFMGLFKKV